MISRTDYWAKQTVRIASIGEFLPPPTFHDVVPACSPSTKERGTEINIVRVTGLRHSVMARGLTEDDFEGKNTGFGLPPDAVEAIMNFDKVVTF
ncbi:MAG: hypothetical protein O2821_02105 [Chloroflexi bacterium]|nr:hypothetical protein [Chloroflexota bacterium]MDA1228142.1 hypothetical protein [Chloroflexota bacterium]